MPGAKKRVKAPTPIRARRGGPSSKPAPAPIPAAVEETADVTLPVLEEHYSKRRRPAEFLSLRCEDCKSDRTVYVDSAASYDDKATAALFNRNGSFRPPLCGFCKRARVKSVKKAA